MISPNAIAGFENIFKACLKETLVVMPQDVCHVMAQNEAPAIQASKVVMLTSSSFVFRLIVLIYFDSDSKTKAHFARRSKNDVSSFSETEFTDAICESGNMCSGSMNRELGRFFPHIGLSTPNLLDKGCADQLHVLGDGHVQDFSIEINQVPLFHARLFVSDDTDLDFTFDAKPSNETAAVDSGELELF
jgi:hypothetical protein